MEVTPPEFVQLKSATPDEIGEYLRRNYFSKFREQSIRSSIVGSAILAFAMEKGKVAIVPNRLVNSVELPFKFEAPELAVSMDGFPASKVPLEPFKLSDWNKME